MKVIGRNAVTEALKSGSTIDRLIAARDLKDAGAQRIINDAKSRGIKIFFYDKEVLDREAAGKKHQGFIAEPTLSTAKRRIFSPLPKSGENRLLSSFSTEWRTRITSEVFCALPSAAACTA